MPLDGPKSAGVLERVAGFCEILSNLIASATAADSMGAALAPKLKSIGVASPRTHSSPDETYPACATPAPFARTSASPRAGIRMNVRRVIENGERIGVLGESATVTSYDTAGPEPMTRKIL